jgi:lysophospholipase L1-like esterase
VKQPDGDERNGRSGVAPKLPSSMVALGDSITQAKGADPSTPELSPHLSWSTGHHPPDPVGSHYERLIDAGAPIDGRALNFAVDGAQMADAPRQANAAVNAGAEYVTILLGANDLCVWSKAWITSLPRFEASFRTAIESLTKGLPDALIYVLSIPDLYRVWLMLHDDPVVTASWGRLRPCRSMFAKFNTEKDRLKVRRMNTRFNETLEKVCAEYENCRFDGHAVFEGAYLANDLGADYFHPSVVGQRDLAEVSWRSGYWGNS